MSRPVVRLDHPANVSILAYLSDPDRVARSTSAANAVPSCAPAEVEDPYHRLGTHPELVERLWDQLGGALPQDCRGVVHGTPVLAHPQAGVIFAFAGGTGTYALRLPPAERAAAAAAGAATVYRYPAYPQLGVGASVLDLATIGREWVFGDWHRREAAVCSAAYRHAGWSRHRDRDQP